MITHIKALFRPVFVFFGFQQEDAHPHAEEQNDDPVEIIGTEGLIEADGIIGKEKDKIALVIDFEFGDVPSWVEWDIDLKQISVAQNGGAVAILKTVLSEKEAQDFESTDHLLFCTNVGAERIVHNIPLILRRSNDNNEDDMADFGKELAV